MAQEHGRPANTGPPAKVASLEHLAEQAKAEERRVLKEAVHAVKVEALREHAKHVAKAERKAAAGADAVPGVSVVLATPPALVVDPAPATAPAAAVSPVVVASSKPAPPPAPTVAKVAVLPATPPPAAEPPAPPTAAAPAGPPADGRRRNALLEWLFRLAPVLGWKRVHARNAARHEGRAALLAHLRARPGDHLRSLARALDMTPQNAAYHLRQLQACGLAALVKHEGKARWFPAEGGRPLQERALADTFLAGAGRAAILAAIVAAPGIHQGEIARRVGAEPGTVNWSLRRLVEQGFLEARAEGNRTCYLPTQLAAGATPPPPTLPAPALVSLADGPAPAPM